MNSKKYKVSKKVARRRKWYQVKKSIIFIMIPFVFVMLAFIALLNQKSMLIEGYDIKGDQFIDRNEIEMIIDKELSGKNMFFISSRSIFLYPEDKIKESLKKSFVEIEDVDVSYKGISEYKIINIDIQQKEKKYIWCAEIPKEECYFVSHSGGIVGSFDQEKTDKKKEDFIIFRGNREKIDFESDNKDEAPDQNTKESLMVYLYENDFMHLERIMEAFQEKGLHIKSVAKIDLGDYVIESHEGVKIIVPRFFSRETIDNFIETGGYDEIGYDEKTGLFNEEIEYVNMLFGKSIVYCKKEDQCVGNF